MINLARSLNSNLVVGLRYQTMAKALRRKKMMNFGQGDRVVLLKRMSSLGALFVW